MTASDLPETPNRSTHLGFVDGEVAGAWHRSDWPSDPANPRRWSSTYTSGVCTWSEALAQGLSPAHDLHDSPTQWAYDRACEALEKHRKRANDAEEELREMRRAARGNG